MTNFVKPASYTLFVPSNLVATAPSSTNEQFAAPYPAVEIGSSAAAPQPAPHTNAARFLDDAQSSSPDFIFSQLRTVFQDIEAGRIAGHFAKNIERKCLAYTFCIRSEAPALWYTK